MTKPVKRWIAVSRKAPCPVCGKPDNCKLSHDGSAVWCGRVSNGAARQNAGGQWLHRLNGHDEASQATDWEDETRALALQAGMQRRELADALGVCPESLKALGIGWNGKDQCWTFPERDADGTVIGLSRRFSDGSKKQAPGSKRGLCYVDGWQETGGPVLIVEGGSDTAAGITLGLPTSAGRRTAVGRTIW